MAETTYNYDRHVHDGGYCCPRHPGGGTDLGDEILAALPGTVFKVVGNAADLDVIFSEALSGEDETALDATVAAHCA